MITIRRQAALAFPQRQPSPPDVVYKPKGLIQTLVLYAGPTSSSLARILT